MPMINGIKMACEPCIRGHRSTKCNHQKERLMVPVRKPGRPLSQCPHPPNKPCGCGGVTAAIPRSQKCGCESNRSDAPAAAATTPPDIKPLVSPHKRSFSIQKQSGRPANRIDPTAFERMNVAHMNIHAPPSWNGNGNDKGNGNGAPVMNHVIMPAIPPAYPPPMSASVNGLPYSQTPVYDQTYNMHLQSQPMPALGCNFETIPFANSKENTGQASDSTSPESTPLRSCCGPRTADSTNAAVDDTTRLSNGSSVPAAQVKSCCSSKATSIKIEPALREKQSATDFMAAHDSYHTNEGQAPPANGSSGHVNLPVTWQNAQPQPMTQFFQPPGPMVYTYPASCGTMQSPLLPDQWRESMTAMYGMPAVPRATPMALPSMMSFDTMGGNVSSSYSHACSCGDSCNCLGCQAHPYNEATQDYVRSAMSSMMDRRVDSRTNGDVDDNTEGTRSGEASGKEPSSPQQIPTPSDASGVSEDLAQLSANDFFFVTYPYGQCGGEKNECPCGDDCQCVGCLIHSTPLGPA